VVSVLLLSVLQTKTILACGAAVIVLLTVLSRKKTNTRLTTVIAVLIFSLALGIIQAFSIGNHELFNINLVFFKLNLYEEGLNKGLISFLKISASMCMVIMLMRTIKISEFIAALKWFRLPKAFIEVMTYTIKFIYIFKDEAASVIKAQKSRLGYRGFYSSITAMSSVAGIVLTRAYDRSKVLSKSMQSRGYNGNT
jgi:cobalt/nickel transport system permease protein